uniref:RNA 3' terminal phosphate cyclase n=1 Tax=Solanum tuberosum TaxID=4113 RepID=M1A8A0_SOLTU
MVPNSLTATKWVDKGLVKRIRGVSFSTRVSVQFENTMIHAARGILNPLLADVHIFTDHKVGAQAGMYDHLVDMSHLLSFNVVTVQVMF